MQVFLRVMLVSCVFFQASAAWSAPERGLKAEFSRAASFYHVPVEILTAVSYLNRRWIMDDGKQNTLEHHRTYGLMGLSLQQVQSGAVLLGIPPSLVQQNISQNIDAYAALFQQQAQITLGSKYNELPTGLGDFYEAVARATKLDDADVELLYSEELYTVMRLGSSVEMMDGRTLVLDAIGDKVFERRVKSTINSIRYMPVIEKKTNDAKNSPQEKPLSVYPFFNILPSLVAGADSEEAHAWLPALYNSGSRSTVSRLVIHTCEGSSSGCIGWFRSASNTAKSSAHYVVSESGRITQMVKESVIAHHVIGYNSISIGIEHGGSASQKTFPAAQIEATTRLQCDIVKRNNLLEANRSSVNSHAELDPTRRTDPGANWPWTQIMADMSDCVSGGGIPAELSISQLWWSPENPNVGDDVTFFATVENSGGNTVANVGIAFYVNNVQIGWDASSPISEGSRQYTMQQKWSAIEAGTFSVEAFVDDLNKVVESNESNNKNQKNITVGVVGSAPDLVITALNWSPDNPQVGDDIVLTAMVENKGSAATDANVGIAFFVDNVQVGWDARGAMVAGELHQFTMKQSYTVANQDTFAMRAWVDDTQIIEETEEGNNTLDKELVLLPQGDPDLAVSISGNDGKWVATSSGIGTVTLNVEVKHLGGAVVPSALLSIYVPEGLALLSINDNADSVIDCDIGEIVTCELIDMRDGDSVVFNTVFEGPKGSNTYKVEIASEIEESDLSNNIAESKFGGAFHWVVILMLAGLAGFRSSRGSLDR